MKKMITKASFTIQIYCEINNGGQPPQKGDGKGE